MNHARFLALAFAFAIVFQAGRHALFADEPQQPAQVTSDAEWNAVFDRTDGWTGADAAGSVDLGDGRTLWLFADTWISKIQNGKRLPGAWMVNNSIAVHPTNPNAPWRPPDPRSVEFFWGPPKKDGHPTAWLVPPTPPGEAKDPQYRDWFWATGGGIVIPRENGQGRRLIVFFFRTRRDPHGKGVWSFATVGTSLAVIDNLSDPPQRWHPRVFDIPGTGQVRDAANGKSAREILWGMSAAAEKDAAGVSRTLIFGTRKSGPFDMGLLIARARGESIERFEDWKPFDDSNSPALNPASARPIAKGLVSEFSVEKIDDHGRSVWVLVQSEPLLGKRIFVRTAPRPNGPWSSPRTIYTVPDVAKSRAYFTYAAKGHASLSRPGELLVTYLVNSQNFGDLVTDTTIYRPKFLRVPLTLVFGK